ncbi:hypothetical protein HYT84_05040 [Candidatus Micrarchaeota archaeon]|nr:hypothetical protein [Candidatus Micrarchaeota archaeon]
MEDLHDFGQRIIDQHLKPNGLESFLKDVSKSANDSDNFFVEMENTKIKNISNQKLILNFKKLHKLYVDWFVLGAVCEPVGIRGEHLIREISKSDKVVSILTTTTRKSFSKRELEDLLRIAIAFKGEQNVTPMLEKHAKKWFWLHNNYFKTQVLTDKDFKKDLETLLSNYPDPKKYLEELEQSIKQTISEKQELIEEFNLTKEQKMLIEVLDAHAWYQDYRKEYTMIMLHYLDLLLVEIGNRVGLSLIDIKWLLAIEVMLLFNDFDPKSLIEYRKKYAFFIWENDKFESFSGDEARKKENQFLKPIKSAKEIVEIPGNIANKGLVRGIARVTMSPEEAKSLQKGEILVTSMTSPDFISAIKKAAAIVTNEGGILCHAAIISREFGIPCIVGTGIATRAIKDGDLIEVDGNHGFVRILKR